MSSLLEQNARQFSIIQGFHLSEKASKSLVFIVKRDANKPTIEKAIEFIFKVKVDSIQVVNVTGKKKRFKQTIGRRKHWKKAYVRLKPGYHIESIQ